MSLRTSLLAAASLASLSLLAACEDEAVVNDTPVRATLDDGQVLMGGVTSEVLELVTGFGTVAVPLADVGEVQPVEGGALGGSGNHVSVWLRNGSELRGEWAEPELEMALDIARKQVMVDLPMDSLERFQLQNGDLMPRGEVFRVQTVFGDDFVVDAERTWVSVHNELGRFEPTLEEIASLERLDGDWPEGGLEDPEALGVSTWRMALDTGTVLIGELEGTGEDSAVLELVLPLGPGMVTLPIAAVVSVERQDWGNYDSYRFDAPAEAIQSLDSGEWFDNRRQSLFKSAQ